MADTLPPLLKSNKKASSLSMASASDNSLPETPDTLSVRLQQPSQTAIIMSDCRFPVITIFSGKFCVFPLFCAPRTHDVRASSLESNKGLQHAKKRIADRRTIMSFWRLLFAWSSQSSRFSTSTHRLPWTKYVPPLLVSLSS